MADYVELDVRGLSCPEPVLLTADALKAHPAENLRIRANEAHVRGNVEKLLKKRKVPFTSNQEGTEYVILTERE